MSISSLGRSIAAPSLREPVSPLTNVDRGQVSKSDNQELPQTQVSPEVNTAQRGGIETEVRRAPSRNNEVRKEEPSATQESAERLVEMLGGNTFELSPSGPLSRPDFRVIDRVNNIDFERAIPPQALRDRIFELREAYIADLSKDTISFDSSSPLGRRVLVIKENINETEFVRQLPASYNEDRVGYLTSFANARGFDFEATA